MSATQMQKKTIAHLVTISHKLPLKSPSKNNFRAGFPIFIMKPYLVFSLFHVLFQLLHKTQQHLLSSCFPWTSTVWSHSTERRGWSHPTRVFTVLSFSAQAHYMNINYSAAHIPQQPLIQFQMVYLCP